MSQKTLLFALFLIIAAFSFITWRGLSLLGTHPENNQANATTTINLDNLAISNEIGS